MAKSSNICAVAKIDVALLFRIVEKEIVGLSKSSSDYREVCPRYNPVYIESLDIIWFVK